MAEEFCYLKRGRHAYEWHIVGFDDRVLTDYMVISKRGLTKYFHNEIEFLHFEQFLQEQSLFNKLDAISFFNLFYKRKNFSAWKKYTTALIFAEKTREFMDKTILSDELLKEGRQFVKSMCLSMEKIDCFNTQIARSRELTGFKEYVEAQRKECMNKIREAELTLLEGVRERIKQSMNGYLKKMRISRETGGEKIGLVDRKVPLLIGDDTGKDMPYTESATIRTHQVRVRTLLKLTDYLVATAKVAVVTRLTNSLLSAITDFNEAALHNTPSLPTWIEIDLEEDDGRLFMNPHSLHEDIEEIVVMTIEDLCSAHFQFLHLVEFDEYWQSKSDGEKNEELLTLKYIIQNNPEFGSNLLELRKELQNASEIMLEHSKSFNQILEFYKYLKEEIKKDFLTQEVDFFKDLLARCRIEMKCLFEIDNCKEVSYALINARLLKKKVEIQYEEINVKVHKELPHLLLERAKKLQRDIRFYYDLICFNPMTIQEYIEFLSNFTKTSTFFENTQPMIQDNSILITLSEAYSIKIPDQTRTLLSDSNGQMIGLSRRISEIEKSANELNEKFKKDIEKLIPTFKERLKEYRETSMSFEMLKNNESVNKKELKLLQLQNILSIIIHDKNEIQHQQEELGFDVTEFEEIDAEERQLKDLESFFSERENWIKLHSSLWKKSVSVIDFAYERKEVESINRKINALSRNIDSNEAMNLIKAEINSFKPLFNATEAMNCASLESKHIQEIKNVIYNLFKGRNAPHSISALIDGQGTEIENIELYKEMEIEKVEEEIIEIAVKAEQESKLLDSIIGVESDWKNLSLAIGGLKEGREGLLLGNNDELISKIDDNLMTMNNVLASKYVAPLKERAETQFRMLRYVQELLDEWYFHQRTWMRLEPILKSPFALKNLPKEAATFGQADGRWRIVMKQAREPMHMRKYTEENHSQHTLKVLRGNNECFEVLWQTMEHLLQKKREHFQRFYFVSDEQLLEVLSTVKGPDTLDPHFKLVFDGLASLQLDEKGMPNKIICRQGESMQLRNCVMRGEIEDWFKTLEESMKQSLRVLIRQALTKYSEQGLSRMQWIRLFPSQIVQVVAATIWTTITESYLVNQEENDLGEWQRTLNTQLEELIGFLRTPLSPVERNNFTSLITQEMHLRDVVVSLAGCDSLQDFRWQKQFRYYSLVEQVVVKQVQSELAYGYEYLGATTRLIVTPLTERTWLSITSAFFLKLGACLFGPSASGKTESYKDLAKALARNCLLFNCSSQIALPILIQLIYGLVCTGSWICFENITLVPAEVLSVFAQQISKIIEAILQGKTNKQITIYDKSLPLNHDIAFFITITHSEFSATIPLNFKSLFRPITLFSIDIVPIVETILLTEGFISAKNISQKVISLHKAAAKQISRLPQYDFGFRAIKNVIEQIVKKKNILLDVSETNLVIKSILEVHLPKLVSQDLSIFYNLLEDLFPSFKMERKLKEDKEEYIKEKCLINKIVSSDSFVEKCDQVKQTLENCFSVIIVGPAFSGKSEIIKTVFDVSPTIINPKAICKGSLFGYFESEDKMWVDGIGSKVLREFANSQENIIFDGPMDPVWLESLSSVLDESRTLCLANGERIKLNEFTRLLFETESLDNVSPGIVSRCGMVYVSGELIDLDDHVTSFFIRYMSCIKQEQTSFFINLIKTSFKKLYAYIQKFAKEQIKLSSSVLMHSYCKMLKNILPTIPSETLSTESWRKALEKACVFAITWSIGALLSEESKPRLDKGLTEAFNADALKTPIINFKLSFKEKPEGEWVSWNTLIPEFEFPSSISYSDIFIPTKHFSCYSFFINSFVSAQDPFLLIGSAGSGKTSLVENALKESNQHLFCYCFSADTSANASQKQLEIRLQPQRKAKAITLIPPPGKQFIYLVDDINMPLIDEFNTQPPIEMLRLLLGCSGLWTSNTFKLVEGICLVGVGTNTRPEMSHRFLHFFNTMYMTEMDDEIITHIFCELTRNCMQEMKFKKEVMELVINKSLVIATIELYRAIKNQIKPTPACAHFSIGLKDVSKVFEQIVCIKQFAVASPEAMTRLWVHEVEAVFKDRFNLQEHTTFVQEEIGKKVIVTLKSNMSVETLFASPVVWTHILAEREKQYERPYTEVTDLSVFRAVVENCMLQETKISLTLCTETLLLVAKVVRVLNVSGGSMTIIGLDGSGKKSVAKLAAVLAKCSIHTLQTNLQLDLFEAMKEVGIANEKTVFFVSSEQMHHSNCNIISLFLKKAFLSILTKEQQEEINKTVDLNTFIKKVNNNLHMVLTFVPGNELRRRLRDYPSLTEGCYVKWINSWAEATLLNVNTTLLQTPTLSEACIYAFEEAKVVFKENSISPPRELTSGSYILLLRHVNNFITKAKQQLHLKIEELTNALDTLNKTAAAALALKADLQNLEPELIKRKCENDLLVKKLEEEREEVKRIKIEGEKEEEHISNKAERALEEKKEIDKMMSDSLPALHAASESVMVINKNELAEFKNISNPHPLIKFTFECVAIALQDREDWDSIKRLITDGNFISRLKAFDASRISSKIETAIKSKIKTNPSFKSAELKSLSSAGRILCEWIHSILTYHDVNKEIMRKREIINELNKELETGTRRSKVNKEELQIVLTTMQETEKKYFNQNSEKIELEDKINIIRQRIRNVEALSELLNKEKMKWTDTLVELFREETGLEGNNFLAACCVSFWGTLLTKRRNEYIHKVSQKLLALNISISPVFTLKEILKPEDIIERWNCFELLNEETEINNIIIAENNLQYCLFLDPEMQAEKLLTQMLAKTKGNYLKITENIKETDFEIALLANCPLIIEIVSNSSDTLLSKLLNIKEFETKNEINVDKKSQIYFITHAITPSLETKLYSELNVINFSMTDEKISQLLLATIMLNKSSIDEEEKKSLTLTTFVGLNELSICENKIIEKLKQFNETILDNKELIIQIEKIKNTQILIESNLINYASKLKEINKNHKLYNKIAYEIAEFYLIVRDLKYLSTTYIYSFEYFHRVFISTIKKFEFEEYSELKIIFAANLYSYISNGMHSKDSIIFAFLLAICIEKTPEKEYRYFLYEDETSQEAIPQIECIEGLSSKINQSLFHSKEIFDNSVFEFFKTHKESIDKYYEKPVLFDFEESFKQASISLSAFQKCLLIKIMSPEQTYNAMKQFINTVFSVKEKEFNFNKLWKYTSSEIPTLIKTAATLNFIKYIYTIVKENNKNMENVHILTLNELERKDLTVLLEKAILEGHWVILLNCHLPCKLLNGLEEEFENIYKSSNINNEFRLICIYEECCILPEKIKMNSTKLSIEFAGSTKQILQNSIGVIEEHTSLEHKALLFNMCYLHAALIGRNKFSFAKWNVAYELDENDFSNGIDLIKSVLHSDEMPYEAIDFMLGEVIYGGKISNATDKRLLKTMLEDFITYEALETPYCDAGNEVEYVRMLPNEEDYNLFGVDANSIKEYLLAETDNLIKDLKGLSNTGNESSLMSAMDQSVEKIVEELLDTLPPLLRHPEEKKNPDPIDLYLAQEATRLNKILSTIDSNLKHLKGSYEGCLSMTDLSENVAESLYHNRVPKNWKSNACEKSLSCWFKYFTEQVKLIRRIQLDRPHSYYLPGFLEPEGLIAAVVQMQARKQKVDPDSLRLQFTFKQQSEEELTEGPAVGTYIHGLFSSGAIVDLKSGQLKETALKYAPVPVIHMRATTANKTEANMSTYEMPLFDTVTKPHNFITFIPCKSDQHESFWIKRSAAFFLTLDY